MRVLVILAHPRGEDSLCGVLAQALARGARAAGCRVRFVDLSRLRFERDLLTRVPGDQPLEPDLLALRGAIDDCEHMVFVYPTWWGTYPGLLKSCLDRLLLPGWAFSRTGSGTGFCGRLGPRTAELITTMDTPGPVYSWLYRAPGRQAMARATLGFCGVKVTRHTRFGPVDTSPPALRRLWVCEAHLRGRRLGEQGPRGVAGLAGDRLSAWLAALRLQFYPMTFIAYWLGAVLGTCEGGELDPVRFWLGYGMLFALEAATVFTNELGDRGTDAANRHWGPFNGGSRVLQDGRLDPADLGRGTGVAVCAVLLSSLALLRNTDNALVLGPLLAGFAVLALGYTVRPLRLSARTLGELDVAVTHGVLAILVGHLIQGGPLGDPRPWLLSVPLALSILPSITLAGVPDAAADRQVAKRTLAVRFGRRTALRLAGSLAPAAALAMVIVQMAASMSPYGLVTMLLAATHAMALAVACRRVAARRPVPSRIDGLMVLSLTFVLWFCVVPLVRLS